MTWDAAPRFTKGMFVARVDGRSMVPIIPDRSYCLFRKVPVPPSPDRPVLVRHEGVADAETEGRFTVKRYREEADAEGGTQVILQPVNAEFPPWCSRRPNPRPCTSLQRWWQSSATEHAWLCPFRANRRLRRGCASATLFVRATTGGATNSWRAPMRLTAAVTREGAWYVARCLEVEVTSQGNTLDEALDNLREALDLYFEDVKPIEPLVTPIIAPIDVT